MTDQPSEDGALGGQFLPETLDPKVLQAADAAKDTWQAEWQDCLVQMLGSRFGRRFFLQLIDRTGVHSEGYSTDASLMAKLAGERAIGIWLIAELDRVDAVAYPGLLHEAGEMKNMQRVRDIQRVV